MKTTIFIIFSLFITTNCLYAQADSLQNTNLLNDLLINESGNEELLPSKILFTQKILWGNKGLMRNFNRFELNPENRQNELKLRRNILKTHQVMGFVTLGGMIAQGIVGAKLYDGDYAIKETHEALGAGVNIAYFTTASLALFAPPKMVNERKGFSSIKLHKALAIIHLSSMIATNVLAGQIEKNPDLRPYHRAAAYTAFGSFAVSIFVIKI
jgi:hypothetical protein